MILVFLGIKIRLQFLCHLLNVLSKLALVFMYPKNTDANSSADDFFCYSYVKYYATLVILLLLLSETISA